MYLGGIRDNPLAYFNECEDRKGSELIRKFRTLLVRRLSILLHQVPLKTCTRRIVLITRISHRERTRRGFEIFQAAERA